MLFLTIAVFVIRRLSADIVKISFINRSFDITRSLFRRVVRIAPVAISYFIGIIAWLFSSVLAFNVVPLLTPSIMAYFIFTTYHIAILTGLYSLWRFLIVPVVLREYVADSEVKRKEQIKNPEAASSSIFSTKKAFIIFALTHLFSFHVFHSYFYHFIIKIGWVEFTLLIWLTVDSYVFRTVAYSL
jgi:hypothetical protein